VKFRPPHLLTQLTTALSKSLSLLGLRKTETTAAGRNLRAPLSENAIALIAGLIATVLAIEEVAAADIDRLLAEAKSRDDLTESQREILDRIAAAIASGDLTELTALAKELGAVAEQQGVDGETISDAEIAQATDVQADAMRQAIESSKEIQLASEQAAAKKVQAAQVKNVDLSELESEISDLVADAAQTPASAAQLAEAEPSAEEVLGEAKTPEWKSASADLPEFSQPSGTRTASAGSTGGVAGAPAGALGLGGGGGGGGGGAGVRGANASGLNGGAGGDGIQSTIGVRHVLRWWRWRRPREFH